MEKIKYEKPILEIIQTNEEAIFAASGDIDTPTGTGEKYPTFI